MSSRGACGRGCSPPIPCHSAVIRIPSKGSFKHEPKKKQGCPRDREGGGEGVTAGTGQDGDGGRLDSAGGRTRTGYGERINNWFVEHAAATVASRDDGGGDPRYRYRWGARGGEKKRNLLVVTGQFRNGLLSRCCVTLSASGAALKHASPMRDLISSRHQEAFRTGGTARCDPSTVGTGDEEIGLQIITSSYGYVNLLHMIGNTIQCYLTSGFDLRNLLETGDRHNSAQLAKMSIDPKIVEATADVVTKKKKIGHSLWFGKHLILPSLLTRRTSLVYPKTDLQNNQGSTKKKTQP